MSYSQDNTDEKQLFRVGCLYDGQDLFLPDAEVAIQEGRIAAIVAQRDGSPPAAATRREFCNASIVALPNSILLPGLINCHQHSYSAFARGIPIHEPLPDFRSVLKKLWWRLDKVLDLEAVFYSALMTAIESVRHGCTTVMDHHSSPRAVRGSLRVIAGAFEKLGLYGVYCYETSDRDGPEVFSAAVTENLEFAESTANSPSRRALFGLHASFTLSDESLRQVASAKPYGLPVHVHLAEESCDVEHARALGYEGPLTRLKAHDLLNDRSLLAHAVHLSDQEQKRASELGSRVVHNPESNLNNRVGYGDPWRFPAGRVLLGTDGMSSNMLGTLRTAFLMSRGFGSESEAAPHRCLDFLFRNPSDYASQLFGRPIGRIQVGEPADFAIFPYHSPTPVTRDNVAAHIVYALTNSTRASWVYAHGRCVLNNGQLAGVDEDEAYDFARATAERIWKRFADRDSIGLD